MSMIFRMERKQINPVDNSKAGERGRVILPLNCHYWSLELYMFLPADKSFCLLFGNTVIGFGGSASTSGSGANENGDKLIIDSGTHSPDTFMEGGIPLEDTTGTAVPLLTQAAPINAITGNPPLFSAVWVRGWYEKRP